MGQVEGVAGLSATRVPAQGEVALDITLLVVVSLQRLLHDRVDVALERVDEAALDVLWYRTDGV